MTDRRFRFGVVAGLARTGVEWTAMAQRAEELGYDIFLVPDTLGTLSPFSALAATAASTRSLRIGTYVLSVSNRSPGLVAWDTASLDLLSGGRFELGLGGGRPAAQRDAVTLGADFGTPSDRMRRLAETIEAVKQPVTSGPGPVQQPHPPILVAASGPRVLRLAAEQADIVALGLPPDTSPETLAAKVAELRGVAGSRFDALELHVNLVAVAETADQIPDWVSRMVGGGDPRAMAAAGGMAFLTGTPSAMADTLRRRRAALAISYVAVNAMFMEQFAPVVEALAGA